MPYIPSESRCHTDEELENNGINWIPNDAGRFNYVVSSFCNNYLDCRGLSYANVNELIGALECCKLELYRRVAAPYEDRKCKENSDVYTV